ncbi:MAG: 2-succinyl-6-hydroxy-2,4-cyclohexadiene-1-carboxylate synthase [Chloroflexota bacterium]|nr:2-succinyl-6-hydroxy-2,4-cyclohexadiene-1-carboxylate synthase [Chloroflexota bacterium]
MTRKEVGGLHLNVEASGDGPALLLLHGFTGSAATWEPFAAAWAGFRTIAVDLIGHGASDAPADESRYTMARCVADVIALLDTLGAGRAAVLGYSMGGRVALHLALAAPDRISALVLEGASPGIEDAGERRARVASDRALADDIERDGVEAFVDRWQALPLFATQACLPDAVRLGLRTQRLRNSAAGLANSLRGMGAGTTEPLLACLHELAMPVLLVAGEHDAKYRTLALAMRDRMPDARVRIVPDAGHAPHLEQPAAFAPLVKEFLTACLRHSERPAPSLRR